MLPAFIVLSGMAHSSKAHVSLPYGWVSHPGSAAAVIHLVVVALPNEAIDTYANSWFMAREPCSDGVTTNQTNSADGPMP